MNLEQVLDLFQTDRQLITGWITEIIEEEYSDSVLKNMILPIFNNTMSKKLRPLIALYTYRIIAGEDADLSKFKFFCSAIEISHNASLVVDDIFDRDDLRRGDLSFYIKYGTFAALSAAYNLSAFVFELATRTENYAIVREFGRVATALSSALYLSKDLKKNKVISEEFFMNLLYRKTSALFEGSSQGGAMLATDDKNIISKFSEIGELFGNAYQLRDDVLAIVGSIEDLGKAPISDITNRFQSLITIEAMRLGEIEDVEILKDFYLRNKDIDPETIRYLIIKSGAINKVMEYALNYRDQALKILYQFPESRSSELLISLTRMINFETVDTTIFAVKNC